MLGKSKWVIAAIVVAYAIVATWRIAECHWANLELQDQLQDIAAQVGTKIGLDPLHADADLRASVIRSAEKLDILLDPSQITIRRTGTGDKEVTFLSVDYTARVNLFLYSMTFHFTPASSR